MRLARSCDPIGIMAHDRMYGVQRQHDALRLAAGAPILDRSVTHTHSTGLSEDWMSDDASPVPFGVCPLEAIEKTAYRTGQAITSIDRTGCPTYRSIDRSEE